MFLKTPEKGKVKSRLADAIGEELTLDIYKTFVIDIIGTLKIRMYPLRIYFYPPDSGEGIENWLGNGFVFMPQNGRDLGERMKNAFAQSFSEGFEKVLITGSDIPDLTNVVIDEAFASLENNDAVIGPSADGGYYLIGSKKGTFLPEIFHGISWGTDSVFHETMKIFQKTVSRVHILPEWRDVDTIDDLRSLFVRNVDTDFRNSGTMSWIIRNKHKIFPDGEHLFPNSERR